MPFQSVSLRPYSQNKSRQVIIKEKVPTEFSMFCLIKIFARAPTVVANKKHVRHVNNREVKNDVYGKREI